MIVKNRKYILLAIPVVAIIVIVVHLKRNGYSSNWNTSQRYLWIFKDSAKADVNTALGFSWVGKSDVYNHFIYKDHYSITVWDFKDLSSLTLNDASIDSNVRLQDIDITYLRGQVLNSKSDERIIIKFGSGFNSGFNIHLDRQSRILKNIEGPNYKGFYGIVDGMAFANERDEELIQFQLTKEKKPMLCLVCKNSKGFYFILIQANDAEYTFDENIVNILNL